MRLFAVLSSCLAAAAASSSQPNLTESLVTTQTLPSTFTPPQVWNNLNLVRTINLEKSYPRVTINVVIENTASSPQDTYYLPFPSSSITQLSAFSVRDKNDAEKPPFLTSRATPDNDSPGNTQYQLIHLPSPVPASETLTLSISYALLSALTPLPAQIAQMDKQYLTHTLSAFVPSSYPTKKQRTKLKLPSADIPHAAPLSATASSAYSENAIDPVRQGATLTYGPFASVPPTLNEPVSVRYEYTRPLPHVAALERDVEVSHWGGNLALEQRYDLANRAAAIRGLFNRVQWAATQYYSPPTSALKSLRVPLAPRAAAPYFVDDVGNVSTSNFRPGSLELRPRYPVFGGWRYRFKVGWDQDLGDSLRRLPGAADSYALKVPFLDGPRTGEGLQYDRVVVRVILPEGATNVKYETPIPLVSATHSVHRTFFDTLGRTTLVLTAENLVDEVANWDLIVTYDYPALAGLRKPVTILTAFMAAFVAAYLLGKVDTSISSQKKKA